MGDFVGLGLKDGTELAVKAGKIPVILENDGEPYSRHMKKCKDRIGFIVEKDVIVEAIEG